LALPPPFRRVYFFHVRKTAGTSFTKAVLGLGGEDPVQVETRFRFPVNTARSGDYVFLRSSRPWLTRHGRYFFGYGHAPWWLVELPADTFTMTILRDPVARLLSYYRYLRDPSADRHERFSPPAVERQWAADGLEAFLDRVPRRHLLNQLWMFSRSGTAEEAAQRIRQCSLYFFTESYDEGLAEFSRRFSLDLARRQDRRSSGGVQPTGTELALLRERLAPELELLELLRADPGPGAVGAVPGAGAGSATGRPDPGGAGDRTFGP
jgi:hypothetical protein